MPQIVKPDRPHAGPSNEPAERRVEVPRLDVPAGPSREDEVGVGPVVTGSSPVGILTLAVEPQGGRHNGRHREHPTGPARPLSKICGDHHLSKHLIGISERWRTPCTHEKLPIC
jgi:hypothetical protein